MDLNVSWRGALEGLFAQAINVLLWIPIQNIKYPITLNELFEFNFDFLSWRT
jgi:hypothetical protein